MNHPKRNEERLTKANNNTKGKIVPVIKLLKSWKNDQNSRTLKSFHIELLCCQIVYTNPELFAQRGNYFAVILRVVDEIEKKLSKKIDISKEINFEADILEYLNENPKRYINSLNKIRSLQRDLRKVNKNLDDEEFVEEKLYSLFDYENNL